MIKSLAYFPSNCALNSSAVIASMIESAHEHGIICQPDSMHCDAALIWSVLWHGRMKNNRKIYEHYRALGRPVIIAEVGCLRRNITWKVCVDNVTRQGFYGHEHDLDPDRPRRLGLVLTQAQGSGILIACQHSRSLQVQGLPDITQWVLEKIEQIRRYSDRAIVVRAHPRDSLKYFSLPRNVTLQFPMRVSNTYDDYNWSSDYHAIVNHNSGPGVLAALSGVRPIVHDSSLAWPVAVNVSAVEQPYIVDREQWLINVAHTEYTQDEIAQGLWLKRLGSRL